MVPSGMANMAKPSVSTAGVRPSVSIMSFLVAAKGSGSSAMACQVMPVVCMVASPFGLGWESGLESLEDAVGDLGEVGDVDVGEVVEDGSAHGRDVAGRTELEQLSALGWGRRPGGVRRSVQHGSGVGCFLRRPLSCIPKRDRAA